jgi:hypothetical protein
MADMNYVHNFSPPVGTNEWLVATEAKARAVPNGWRCTQNSEAVIASSVTTIADFRADSAIAAARTASNRDGQKLDGGNRESRERREVRLGRIEIK